MIVQECTGEQIVKKPSNYPDLWKLMVKWQRKYAEAEATSHVFRYVVPKGGDGNGSREASKRSG